MIRVIVEPYCQNCRYFKPYISDKGYTTFPEHDTIVCCENDSACTYARDELKKKMEDDAGVCENHCTIILVERVRYI